MEKGLTQDFTDKVAVITGGGGVLCGEMALALGRSGATVVVADIDLAKGEGKAQAITASGGIARAMQVNVLEKDSLDSMAQQVTRDFGQVDILINGAGGTRKEATTSEDLSFFDLPEDAARWVFDLNFMGTFLSCQAFGPRMVEQGKGSILNVASMSAIRALTRSAAYSAAKAAVLNFTQWLAVHMSQEYSQNIRVNAVVPGFFLTEQNRFLIYDEKDGKLTSRGQQIIDHTPMGRLGEAEDLVGPVLMLLSDSSRFVHGTGLVVDGGFSAYGGV